MLTGFHESQKQSGVLYWAELSQGRKHMNNTRKATAITGKSRYASFWRKTRFTVHLKQHGRYPYVHKGSSLGNLPVPIFDVYIHGCRLKITHRYMLGKL